MRPCRPERGWSRIDGAGGRPAPRRAADRGTGIFATSASLLAFLLLLLFACQVIFGLYARTTLTAVASDAARQAARAGITDERDPRLSTIAAEARDRLGRYGEQATITAQPVDTGGRAGPDIIEVRVSADLPTLLPERWSLGGGRVERTYRARIEQFVE